MIDIIIKRPSADNIAAGKFTHSSAAITAGVERPAIFKEVPLNVINKFVLFEKVRFSTTVLTMVLINALTLLGFITFDIAVIQLNGSSLNLIVNCTRGLERWNAKNNDLSNEFE